MDDPIKVIWKYKNNTGHIQYIKSIFIGNNVSKDIMKILNEIKNKSFYETINDISQSDYKKMSNVYGNKWYEKFFIVYHINYIISLLKDKKLDANVLKDKYGDEWYKEHILSRQTIQKEIIYSYEAMIKYENEHKKTTERTGVGDVDTNIDFRTIKSKVDDSSVLQSREKLSDISDDDTNSNSSKSSIDSSDLDMPTTQSGGGKRAIQNYFTINNKTLNEYQTGGSYDDDDEYNPEEAQDDTQLQNDDVIVEEGTEEQIEEFEENDKIFEDDESELQEIEEIYKENDVEEDKKLSETAKRIRDALNDEKIFEKNLLKMVNFDTSENKNSHNSNLNTIYVKQYVTTNFIYKDDSIKMIRNKICCSLKMDPDYSEDLYLIPSRQYLWIEYEFQGEINKISVGQKWMRKNELLNIDIEPNSNIHYYADLRGQLGALKDNMKRYNNKIRRDDEDNTILYDYENYMTNNEIYMIDLYHELGMKYNPSETQKNNLQEVYLKLYFPKVRSDDIKMIFDFLNNVNKNEIQKNQIIFETINNDLILENEIVDTVEHVKATENYQYLFKDNYITQSDIFVNLRYSGKVKLNLYKIFDEFILNDDYPFIQYQTNDGNIIYKFNEKSLIEYFGKNSKMDIITKWFENAPYCVSIKTKVMDKSGEKFLSINLNDNGKMEYKTQWKEEDMSTIDDIKKTYEYIHKLINKINAEKSNIHFEKPYDSEFKYAFINTIQKFKLPEKFTVNHNDLSNFSRYFFPFVALVIDPKKRQSKSQKDELNSKYGTYLRYKRVSKYDNQARIEQRIMYFIRNFEFTEKNLIDELEKQFNITEQKAMEEYERVKAKYPHLKRARKNLKKMENIPKYKPPGIGIDIQGKEPEKYKIRISGARNKTQLTKIITFMNILMHLYVETYLKKDPEKQKLRKRLNDLKDIAFRRNKVVEFQKRSNEIATIKQMTKGDKKRIGFTPEKGQNQWTRSCQNSGDTKRRRPQQYNSNAIGDLLKKGYFLNKKTGNYERKVIVKENGKKKEVTLQAVKFAEYDDDNGELSGNEIFYTCDPVENGEHFYVGFLTKSKNPYGQCMPCCFKKDQLHPTTKKKKDLLESCLNPEKESNSKLVMRDFGDKLYILQDTNKLHDGRVGFLPKYLDIYFNFTTNRGKSRKIKQHYLVQTSSNGYFFKYGSNQDEYQFLNCIGSCLNMTVNEIKEKMIAFLEKDKNMQYFTSLGNGDVKTNFKTIDSFIQFIKNSEYIDYSVIGDLISIPNVLTKNGLNLVIFNKKVTVIDESLERERIREDFYIYCQNLENTNGLKENKDCVFIVKEINNYYPIVLVIKEDENDKVMDIIKKFTYENKSDNIVNHVNDFYEKSCLEYFIENKQIGITAKMTYKLLQQTSNTNFHVKSQYVDSKNKCKYLITQNNTLVPVYPSGSLYNVPIIKNGLKGLKEYVKSYSETLTQINELLSKVSTLPIKQIGVYIEPQKTQSNKIVITGIMTDAYYLIPVLPESSTVKSIEDQKLLIEQNPQIEDIDISIEKNIVTVDERIKKVTQWKYESGSYELFRYEFSNFINKPENATIRTKLETLINSTLSKGDKINKIKLFLYKLVSDDLYQKYKKIVESESGMKGGKLIQIVEKTPDLSKYNIANRKTLCEVNDTKDKCNINPHCKWHHSSCTFISTIDNLIIMINKLSVELAQNEVKAFEILRIHDYFVDEIGDYNKFTERDGQKIVKSTSSNINKVLNEVFGKDRIFYKSGKRRMKLIESSYNQLNHENPLTDMGSYYIQKIIPNNMSLFRAYTNAYYWIKNKFSDLRDRNLGYYHPVQSDLATYFKSSVIEWILKPINSKLATKEIEKMVDSKLSIDLAIEKFIQKIAKDFHNNEYSYFKLFILNKINDIPIVVYDDLQTIIFIIDGEIVYDGSSKKPISKQQEKYNKNSECINIKFTYNHDQSSKNPDKIDVIYFGKTG
jgi:hypothetical protein